MTFVDFTTGIGINVPSVEDPGSDREFVNRRNRMRELEKFRPKQQAAKRNRAAEYFSRGLSYFARGVAGAVLAPLEVLKHVQQGLRVGGRLAGTWAASATTYLCLGGIWFVTKLAAHDGRLGEILVLGVGTIASTIWNGWLQSVRTQGKLISLVKIA